MNSETPNEQQLWPLVKNIKFAMFTTHHHNSVLHSRPMTTQNKEMPDDKLWFFMSIKGDPVKEIAKQPEVNLAYADLAKDTFVSVSGTAQVVDDKAQLEALWNKIAEAWFPGGMNDPDLALVRVTVNHAHYWNVRENKLTQLLVMAKAAFTGEKAAIGESGEASVGSSSKN